MKNKWIQIAIACCAVFCCAAAGYSQSETIETRVAIIQSIPPGVDTCSYLKGFENSGNFTEEQYHEIYDSLRLYVQLCGPKDCTVSQAFHSLDAAVQFMSNDSTRFDPYRTWLLTVLYLNPSCPEFYCLAMRSIQSTYQYGKYAQIGGFAVVKYLREHHQECWDSAAEKEFQKNLVYLKNNGFDTSKVPPLDSIGLSLILQHDANATILSPSSFGIEYLASFASSPNPFVKETTLEFTLNRMSYITLSIFDDLGRLVWGDGRGSSIEAGAHTIQIDGSKLPSGTLYARIATGFGEVKTVKLVHEK